MSTIGNIDGYIEVVLKINDTTGKVEKVVGKTMSGEFIDFEQLKDRDWWLGQIDKWEIKELLIH